MTVSSLRLRLLLLALVSIGVTLALEGAALSVIFERHMERRVADELKVRWDELAAALIVDPKDGPQLDRVLSDPRYQRPYSGAYWQISDETGPRLRSRSLWDEVLPAGAEDHMPSLEADERTGPNGSEIYVVERGIERGSSEPRRYRLAVALDHAEINALREGFVGDATTALVVLGAALLVGAAAQAAIGLRPLQLLRAQLAEIQAGRSARLSGNFPDEVAPLASSLNLLLEQQEIEVARARERAGDLAHGLKTPLTILAGEARRLDENGERGGAKLLREQVAFMRGHVERELARARTRGASAARGSATDVAETVGKLVDLLRRIDKAADLAWRVQIPEGLRVRMDPYDLGEVLGNLLDNARKWARTRVVVTARPRQDRFELCVADDGPGIPQAQYVRLRERGERGDCLVEGSGLGLSIVKGVLDPYGLVLNLAASEDGGCAASLTIEGWIEAGSVTTVDVQHGLGRAMIRSRAST